MTAAQFLAVLERDKLVSLEVLASLRQQVASAHEPIAPVTLAKLLVAKGKLHWLKAQQLLPQETFKPDPNAEAKERAAASAIVVKESTESLEASFGIEHEVTDHASESPSHLSLLAEPGTSGSPSPQPTQKPKQGAAKSSPRLKSSVSSADSVELDESLDALEGGSSVLGGLEELLDAASLSTKSAAGSTVPAGKSTVGQGLASAALQSAPAARPSGYRKPRWLWAMFAVLGMVVVGGCLLAVVLLRGNGNEQFQAAEAEFQQQAYGPAIEKYSALLGSFPRHSQAETARVRRAIATIRQAAGPRPDWHTLLPIMQTQLREVGSLGKYTEYSAEMIVLLGNLVAGLCEQVEQTNSAADQATLVTSARDAIALLNDDKIVPPNDRPWQKIEAWQDRLELTEYRTRQSVAVLKCTATVQAAIAAKQPEVAYAALADLRAQYPAVIDEPAFASFTEQLAQIEIGRAQVVHEKLLANFKPRDEPVQSSVTPAIAQGQAIPALRGHTYLVTQRDVAYALNAETGRLIWRRYVGLDAGHVELPDNQKPRALLFGIGQRELTCVEVKSGKITWRLELSAALASVPVAVKDSLFVPLAGGRLLVCSRETGESNSQLQLPLPIAGDIGVSSDGAWLYVLAESGVLFSIHSADLKVQSALPLKLRKQQFLAPVVAGRSLLVVDNRGDADAAIWPIALDKQGAATSALQPILLSKYVSAAPTQAGGKLFVPTAQRELLAFELTTNARAPLKAATGMQLPAMARAEDTLQVCDSGQLIAAGSDVYGAARGLHKWNLASAGKPAVVWTNFADQECTAPRLFGDHVIVTHTISGNAGFCVSAIEANSGKPLWQAHLGTPLLQVTSEVASAKTSLLTGAGKEFKTSLDKPVSIAQQTSKSIQRLSTFDYATPLDNGAWLQSALGSENVTHIEGTSIAKSWKLAGKLACAPRRLGSGVLMPLTNGTIWLLDPGNGQPLAAPFVPRIQADAQAAWQIVAVGASTDAVVCDGRQLFRIALAGDPLARLSMEARLESDLAHSARGIEVGSAGKPILLMVDGGHTVWTCDRQSLAIGQQWPLDASAIVWGPHRVGELALIATDRDELHAFTGDGPAWKQALPAGPPVGAPLGTAQSVFLATARGQILVLDPKAQKPTTHVDLGQGLAFGPIAVGNALGVGTTDGTFVTVRLPEVN